MASNSLAPFNVVATYPDMSRARRAIDALQFGGVEAGKISLLGEGARQAEQQANQRKNTTDRDAPVAQRLIGRALFWGAAGAIVGAALGLVLGALGVNFAPAVDNFLVQTLAWALFGAIVGSLWGGFSGISQGDAWELTYASDGGDVDGQILVAVHSDNENDIQRAEKIMREKDAVTIGQFDADGNAVPRTTHI